jgi:hypothetical protein
MKMKKFLINIALVCAIVLIGFGGLKLTSHQPTDTGIIRNGTTYKTNLTDSVSFYLEWSSFTGVPLEIVEEINKTVGEVYYETGDSNLTVVMLINELNKRNIKYKDITGELMVN